MASSTPKPRRPKPVNYGKRRTLRFGDAEEAAVESLRLALSKSRGKKVGFSEAHRLLLTENEKAARVLAGQPEKWISTEAVELPAELWDALTQCGNALSHSRGSLYNISRKVNFGEEPVTRDEVSAAFDAVQTSKKTVAALEARMAAFMDALSSGAAAQNDTGAA